MELGTFKRLSRLFDAHSRRTLIVPMDHGMTGNTPDGLRDMGHTIHDMKRGGANAVLVHKGFARREFWEQSPDLGFILHLSASTTLSARPDRKRLVGDVEEALRLGADAVSVHVNLGGEDEDLMLAEAGLIASECRRWGMPLLMMLYARQNGTDSFASEDIAHCARVGAELGADIVKVPYTGSYESFRTVTECCPVPVVIAGGPMTDSELRLFQMVHDALLAGGAGISIGRNIFEHPKRFALLQALCALVHGRASVDDAMAIMASTD